MRKGLVGATAALTVAHGLPGVTAIRAVRGRWFPALSGVGSPGHLALTFDDGPDPRSTPRFLEVLDAHRVTATFFLLGEMVQREPGLAAELVAAGHEVGVHGWSHRSMLLRTPRGARADLRRAYDTIAAATGAAPVFYRPPNGVLSTGSLLAARQLGLTPVLWTADGRDWTAQATPHSVYDAIRTELATSGHHGLAQPDPTARYTGIADGRSGLADLTGSAHTRTGSAHTRTGSAHTRTGSADNPTGSAHTATGFPDGRTGLAGGGTVLLHDSDCTSAPQAWRAALGALPMLLTACAREGVAVGPLRDHGGQFSRTARNDSRSEPMVAKTAVGS